LHWKTNSQFNLAHKLKKLKTVLNGTKKSLKKNKNKNQETDGYGRDERFETEQLKRKEITITEN